jgi:hypothetical protein
MSNSIEILERFHRALVEEIQTQRPEYLTGPFTVAEIYQNLVPYGSHRDRIGVRINGDYEDALLRLLRWRSCRRASTSSSIGRSRTAP